MFDVQSTAEAVRALIANFPEAQKILMQGHYRIVCGAKTKGLAIDGDTLHLFLPTGQPIHIIPAGGGAKNGGVAKTIAGVALIALSVVAPYAGAPAAGLFGGAITWGSVGILGMGLALTGISQLLTGTPKMPKMENFEREETPSFLLGGAVNASGQGLPLPIIGGQMRCGGVVISAGITVQDFT